MSVQDYVVAWKAARASSGPGSLYLKDWHFAAEFPEYKVRFALAQRTSLAGALSWKSSAGV